MRKERYFHLPLCASDCNEWFEACKSDYTCRDNWNVGFKWINGTNFCPQHEKCDTFENKFKNANNFCSKIWDESFQVEDTSNCVTFQFENASYNPNKQVNDFYAIKNSQISNRILSISYVFILAISSIFSLLIN
jgi:folate receptor